MRVPEAGCCAPKAHVFGEMWVSFSPHTPKGQVWPEGWKRERIWGRDKSRKWQGGGMDPQARWRGRGAKGLRDEGENPGPHLSLPVLRTQEELMTFREGAQT